MSGKLRILLFALLCLVLFRSNSYADGDFSSMSDEELLCVQTELNAEITKRGLIKQIELPPGIYEAGVDIPVGKYVVTAIKESSGIAPIVRVFKNLPNLFVERQFVHVAESSVIRIILVYSVACSQQDITVSTNANTPDIVTVDRGSVCFRMSVYSFSSVRGASL